MSNTMAYEIASSGDPHHILAATGATDDRPRVLKHGDAFAVFDHRGRIKPRGLGEEGLYYEGTRYLSCLVFELDGRRPFFLGSTVRDDDHELSVALTNPDEEGASGGGIPLGTLHLAVRTFLWDGVCHWQARIKNHGPMRAAAELRLRFRADFADIYEVRGMKRPARGREQPPEVGPDRVVLGYVGLDSERRRTLLRVSPRPRYMTPDEAHVGFSLEPGEETVVELAVACWRGESAPEPPEFEAARRTAANAREQYRRGSCRIETPDGRFDAWVRRATSDLHMLTTELPTGPYPYAGIPWFNTPFGRDALITALECLWLRPGLARGVLEYLASTQATEVVPDQDAEPGKILHETRSGEMAVLKEMPFGRYYGGVDATPLFVALAGAYFERTNDLAFVESIWPSVEAALGWIDRYGDLDGDGFVEYQRWASDGLAHQGWKDSDDAVAHSDGAPAHGPIALCEVQAYVYAARRAGAVMAAALGMDGLEAALLREAEKLRRRFEATFWLDDLGTYAMALDGDKRPCRVKSSNAGHCLFAGIVNDRRAARVAAGLMAPDSFSGWGVRTLASTERRYNPMAYHNGSVWPHDNALIALGFARYGMTEHASRILEGMYEAGTHIDLNRMPELFCGFERDPGEGPTPYPVACAPQAWAAGSVLLLIQACLGLTVTANPPRLRFLRPQLPPNLPELRITNLQVGCVAVDLLISRNSHGIDVDVRNASGEVIVDVDQGRIGV